MKKPRLVFYIIFSAFHLFLFLFTLYIDSQKQNIQFLLSLQSKIWLLKYGSFLGIVLIATELIWDRKVNRTFIKEKDQLNHELNSLKAKLFDLQESEKAAALSKTGDKR